ncbi:MAG: sulfotransferase family protein [Planctomycetota bacterium]|jgi:hypothetical protein
MKKPNFFIVGQPRCGTSALHTFMAQHPDIYMSPAKEPHHFCKDIIQQSDDFYGHKEYYLKYRSLEDYMALFSDITNETIIGESTANYLYSKVAAEEIFNFNPDAKIIAILREPVDFLYSWYGYLFSRLQENAESFEKAIELEAARKNGNQITQTIEAPCRLFYSERIKYYEQLKRFYDIFPKENIKIIIFDDFQADNEVVYKQILSFLQLDTDFDADFSKVNVRKNPRFRKLNQIILHPGIVKPLKVIIPSSVRAKMTRMVHKLFYNQKQPQPLGEDFKKQLMLKFKPEVAKISDFLDIDLIKRWDYGLLEM